MATQVLYDEQCNFCKVIVDTLLSWDRAGRLAAVSIQSDAGQELLASVPPARRLDSFHTVDESGTLRSAGPALGDLFGRLPAGAPLKAVLERTPRQTSAAYSWIAANRVAISRFVPSPLKRRATRRLAAGR